LQRDPEGFVDSVNVYAALANDPVNNRDPTGRWVNVAVGAAAGGAIGGVLDLVHQAAELMDAGKAVNYDNINLVRAFAAAGQGVLAGAAVGACPMCGVGLASFGATSSAIAAQDSYSKGKKWTALADSGNAALAAFGGGLLAKGLASGRIAPVDQAVANAVRRIIPSGAAPKPIADQSYWGMEFVDDAVRSTDQPYGGKSVLQRAAEQQAIEAFGPPKLGGEMAGAIYFFSGRIFRNVSGPATRPKNPLVAEILDSIPASERGRGHGGCWEVGAVSDALAAGESVGGGQSYACMVRSPQNRNYLAPAPACPSCKVLLRRLGITDVNQSAGRSNDAP
jgi:hypothetical protein